MLMLCTNFCAHIRQGSKPWRYTGNEENMEREDIKMLVKKWWDIYEDESLDHKVPKPIANGNLGSFIAALSEDGVTHQRSAPSAA